MHLPPASSVLLIAVGLSACTLSEPPPAPSGSDAPGTAAGAPPPGAPGGAGAPAPGGAGGAGAPGGAPGADGAEGTGPQPAGSMAGAGGPNEPKLKPRSDKACSWTPETEKRIAALNGVDTEKTVAISGSFQWDGLEGPRNRPVLMEVLLYDDSDAISQRLSAVCDHGSDVHLELPAETGKIQLAAFLDQTGNGPDDSDPAGRTEAAVEVGTVDISDFSLTISTSPKLGDLSGLVDGSGSMPRGG